MFIALAGVRIILFSRYYQIVITRSIKRDGGGGGGKL